MSGPRPTDVVLHQASHVLEIAFDDGRRFRLPYEYLRVESPSAEVQGHGPSQKVLVAGKRDVIRAGRVRATFISTRGQSVKHALLAPLSNTRHPAALAEAFLISFRTHGTRAFATDSRLGDIERAVRTEVHAAGVSQSGSDHLSPLRGRRHLHGGRCPRRGK